MDIGEKAIKLHKKYRGKIETRVKVPLRNIKDLSLAYTPGVAKVCQEIKNDISKVYDYTDRGNLVAIVTDGSAVLGLGNIGPEAALPVMEGKAALFKKFANVDAIPICLKTQDVDEIVNIVKNLEPSFGGINLEDISAPRCFEIEERLKKEMNIPVFHDDQHGTAIVVLAGLINALKIVKKNFYEIKVVINGAGAAGLAIAKLLLNYGVRDIVILDSKGAIYAGREDLNFAKAEIATKTNFSKLSGKLEDVLLKVDVFIGVSAPNILKQEWIKLMNREPIIFAMANPIPEIDPDIALKSGAKIVATGRSDYPNQINNVLVFPGIFRGIFDCGAKEITDKMKIGVAKALAAIIPESKLKTNYIIPRPFDKKVVKSVSTAVKNSI